MENKLEDFIEEYEQDRRFAIDHIDMFKSRMERRIKKFAIVDVEYYYEDVELLGRAQLECYDEIDWLINYMKNQEEYECCQLLKDLKLTVQEVYDKIHKEKLKQVKS